MMVLKHGPHVSINSDMLSSITSRSRKSTAKKSKLKTSSNIPNASTTTLAPIQVSEELCIKQERDDSDYDAYTDDAYAADEESNSSMTISKYTSDSSLKDEEQRKIEEGADALLNLAGIHTSSSIINNNHIVMNHNSDIRNKKYRNTHSHLNSEYQSNGYEEENYKPRFIRRNYSTKKSLKRKADVTNSNTRTDNHNNDKISKVKKIKLVKNPEKAKR
ncbi:hypothetical protein WDU94_009565 [Cyamophila willieti]